MLNTKCYIPVKVEDEYPGQDIKTIFFRGDLDTRVVVRGYEEPFTHWLKTHQRRSICTDGRRIAKVYKIRMGVL